MCSLAAPKKEREKSLSQFMYFVFTCRSFSVCEDIFACYHGEGTWLFSPTIKVYQHKLNKKEFKLAFKL